MKNGNSLLPNYLGGHKLLLIDLIFYHLELRCYVVVELKIGVSTYKLKEQLPKELMDKLPTEEEINLYLDIDETNMEN